MRHTFFLLFLDSFNAICFLDVKITKVNFFFFGLCLYRYDVSPRKKGFFM